MSPGDWEEQLARDPLAVRLAQVSGPIVSADLLQRVRLASAADQAAVSRLAPERGRHVSRRLVWSAVVAIALAIVVPVLTLRLLPSGTGPTTVNVSGFTLTVAAATAQTPRMTPTQALAAGREYLTALGPPKLQTGQVITGLTITGATFVADVTTVWKPCIHIYLPHAESLWVITVSAPAQAGWSAMHGGILINDADGSASGGDLLISRSGTITC